MDPEKLAELEGAATAAAKAAEDAGGADESLNTAAEEAKTAFETAQSSSQDPVKIELEKEQRKAPKSEAEKAAFTLKKNAERARELGISIEEVLGIKEPGNEDENRPLTVGEYKKQEAQKAQKTALQFADSITNVSERELTKHYLQNRIVPSGDPEADFRLALAAVNSVKNGQIAAEMERKPFPQHFSSGSGGPAKKPEGEFKPTSEEADMMAKFGLTKQHILSAREKTAATQQ